MKKKLNLCVSLMFFFFIIIIIIIMQWWETKTIWNDVIIQKTVDDCASGLRTLPSHHTNILSIPTKYHTPTEYVTLINPVAYQQNLNAKPQKNIKYLNSLLQKIHTLKILILKNAKNITKNIK